MTAGPAQTLSEADALWRAASALARRARRRHALSGQRARRLPPLLFFTDPDRTPDPLAVAARLPQGAGIVYRHFGGPEREDVAAALAALARARGLKLLIGNDEGLAARVGAVGVHLPERRLSAGPGLRARYPRWLVTGAAHDGPALALARMSGLDAAVLSAVFPSRSPSAGPALGAVMAAALIRRAGLPVYALGGVNAFTVPRLVGTGFVGVAAVDGLG